jgi:regulator of sigma E protease
MIVVMIIIGILGLGLVILVHELGHYFAARAAGVEVEAFSIGWGPKLASWKRGQTEWKLSAIPLGGYCRMKGEEAFAAAIQNKSETIPREPGSFYGAPAWKRIIISISGPLANVIFAAIVFIIVSAVGTSMRTDGNRIVLQSEFPTASGQPSKTLPADQAGLKSGDTIIAANGKPVRDFIDLQDAVTPSPEKPVRLVVARDGTELGITVTPYLDKNYGAGFIGVRPWIDPVVASVSPNGPAGRAGVAVGDRLVSLDGKPVRHMAELEALLATASTKAVLTVERAGKTLEMPVVLDGAPTSLLGLGFARTVHVTRSANLGAAVTDGMAKTWSTFAESVKALGLLFRGVNVLQAISGPARITYFAGKVAVDSVAQSGAGGLATFFDFLAFLSIALFIMNLLPIPALDGGMIVLFIMEIIRNRPLRTKTVYRFQFIGMAFILALFLLATLSDFIFFSAR